LKAVAPSLLLPVPSIVVCRSAVLPPFLKCPILWFSVLRLIDPWGRPFPPPTVVFFPANFVRNRALSLVLKSHHLNAPFTPACLPPPLFPLPLCFFFAESSEGAPPGHVPLKQSSNNPPNGRLFPFLLNRPPFRSHRLPRVAMKSCPTILGAFLPLPYPVSREILISLPPTIFLSFFCSHSLQSFSSLAFRDG